MHFHQVTNFILALLLLLTSTQMAVFSEAKAVSKYQNDPSFDYLILAQFWPPASCYIYEGKKLCEGIPKGVSGFTLHGLWPSIPSSMEPIYCDNSTHFDYNKIASLEDKLSVQWPYYVTKNVTGLWSHEWTKHGTCAGSVPELKGEFNYFSKTMNLHLPLDVLGALEKQSIVPSNDVMYRPQDIYNSLLAHYGVKPTLLCDVRHFHEGTKYFLDQVYLCFTKDFVLKDCVNDMYIECPKASEKVLRFLPFRSSSMSEVKTESQVLFFESETVREEVGLNGSE